MHRFLSKLNSRSNVREFGLLWKRLFSLLSTNGRNIRTHFCFAEYFFTSISISHWEKRARLLILLKDKHKKLIMLPNEKQWSEPEIMISRRPDISFNLRNRRFLQAIPSLIEGVAIYKTEGYEQGWESAGVPALGNVSPDPHAANDIPCFNNLSNWNDCDKF